MKTPEEQLKEIRQKVLELNLEAEKILLANADRPRPE